MLERRLSGSQANHAGRTCGIEHVQAGLLVVDANVVVLQSKVLRCTADLDGDGHLDKALEVEHSQALLLASSSAVHRLHLQKDRVVAIDLRTNLVCKVCLPCDGQDS